MSIRLAIAALCFLMVNAVLFGTGLITIVSFPALYARAKDLLPLVVVASFVIAAPIAWFIAPRLRARYGRERQSREP
jgi:hypothetical protein